MAALMDVRRERLRVGAVVERAVSSGALTGVGAYAARRRLHEDRGPGDRGSTHLSELAPIPKRPRRC